MNHTDWRLSAPLLVVTGHMGGIYIEAVQDDVEAQERWIVTPCDQCGDSDMIDAKVRTWDELDEELMALAGDGWSDDALLDVVEQVRAHYCPRVDERTVDDLSTRLREQAQRWWDDNENAEDEP